MKYLKLLTLLVIAAPSVDDIISVVFYDASCHIAAHYVAETIDIKQTGDVTLYFKTAAPLHTNLKYKDIANEMQLSAGAYFRSYSFEDEHVVERTEPICKGAI